MRSRHKFPYNEPSVPGRTMEAKKQDIELSQNEQCGAIVYEKMKETSNSTRVFSKMAVEIFTRTALPPDVAG